MVNGPGQVDGVVDVVVVVVVWVQNLPDLYPATREPVQPRGPWFP